MSGTRTAKKAATRARVLAMAKRMFAADGFEATGIRHIAKACKLSTGAVFCNWPTKEALFTEAMGRPFITDTLGSELLVALRFRDAAEADRIMTGAGLL